MCVFVVALDSFTWKGNKNCYNGVSYAVKCNIESGFEWKYWVLLTMRSERKAAGEF